MYSTHGWFVYVLILNSKYREITPAASFTNSYAEEVYESEHVRTSTKCLHVILDAKY